MREQVFQKKIIDWLEKEGAWVVKFHASGMTKKGVPDLLVCWKGNFLALEVKTNSRTTEIQKYQIDKIIKANGYAFVVNPENWDNIRNIIRSL